MSNNEKLKEILEKKNNLMTVQVVERRGVPLEKGVVLTVDYLNSIKPKLEKKMQIYTACPDLYLDDIRPENSSFKLFFYQRILLRALMRYKQVFVTAPRAFSKSFITILSLILQCIFMPGTKRFICAPNKNQSAQIAKEKISEIFQHWPLLRREVVGGDITELPGNYGKDYVKQSMTYALVTG